jgi:RNA-directed DNA polymerase
MRQVIYRNRGLSQENLIRIFNPVIRGWANYHRHVAASATFRKANNTYGRVDSAKRRNPKKFRSWVLRRYWHTLGGRKGRFAALLKKTNAGR